MLSICMVSYLYSIVITNIYYHYYMFINFQGTSTLSSATATYLFYTECIGHLQVEENFNFTSESLLVETGIKSYQSMYNIHQTKRMRREIF